MNHHPYTLSRYSVASLITGQVGHFWKADPGHFSLAPKQNGQVTPNNWKTVLSSSASQSAPYVSNYNTPHIQYGAGANACNDGVCGIPTQVGMVVNQTLPSAIGSGTTTNFNMTTEDLTGAGGFTLRWRQWPGDPSQDILTVTVGGN